jgi:hypothetical protein
VGSQFVIEFHVKTLSTDQKPWIGIYEYALLLFSLLFAMIVLICSAFEERPGQWKRYKYVENGKGAITIDANLPRGHYEARLLDSKSTQVFAKSQTIVIE